MLCFLLGNRAELTYEDDFGEERVISCNKVIFIFISDIGAGKMYDAILEFDGRENIPRRKLIRLTKRVLDNQWQRLRFNHYIDRAVPFLPLEAPQIEDVVKLKLEALAMRGKMGKFPLWGELDYASELTRTLASRQFIKYDKILDDEDVSRSRFFAKFGGRNVVTNGPLQLLKAVLRRLMPSPVADAELSQVRIRVGSDSTDIDHTIIVERCVYARKEPGAGRFESAESCSDGDGHFNEQCEEACTTLWSGNLLQ